MQIIDGKQIAAGIYAELKTEIAAMEIKPKLGVIQASADPAAATYINLKSRRAAEVGIEVELAEFPETVTSGQIISTITKFNQDPSITGTLVQLPLYPHLHSSQSEILNAINPQKDADGLTAVTLGKVMQGNTILLPATVAAVLECIQFTNVDHTPDFLQGKQVVVINHSALIGKPLAAALLRQHATVTVLHKYTVGMLPHLKSADIIVSATGVTNLISADMIKQGTTLIDVTSIKVEDETFGDVIVSSDLESSAAWLTPVPGGVGPVTIACLLRNLVNLSKSQQQSPT